MNFGFTEHPKITLIKIIAIVFVTIIYSYGSILVTLFNDRYIIDEFYDKDETEIKKKSTFRHFFEMTIILAIIGILAYFTRNVLEKVPFPFHGVEGFDYFKVKEVTTGSIVLMIMMNYSVVLSNKIKSIKERLEF